MHAAALSHVCTRHLIISTYEQALGSEFDGPYDMREGDHGVEARADVYTAVTEAIGLKRRVCGCWLCTCVCVCMYTALKRRVRWFCIYVCCSRRGHGTPPLALLFRPHHA